MSANIPPVVQRTVAQHIESFRQVLLTIDNTARQGLNSFWRDVRQSLNDQDATIAALNQQIQQLQQNQQQPVIILQPPARPNTSDSTDVIRRTVETAIQYEAQYADDASVTIEAIADLDPTWAMNFMIRQKNVLISNASELGCWLSGNVAGHDTGYVKVNMRNTLKPDSQVKFGVQPWVHQMGVVAGGRGHELRLTTDSSYHVSHLCHNPSCFNPEHVVVEPQDENKQRNSCHHSFIIRVGDGTVINPCVHWRLSRRMHCILPTRDLAQNMRGKWVDMTTEGPITRTGRSNQ